MDNSNEPRLNKTAAQLNLITAQKIRLRKASVK